MTMPRRQRDSDPVNRADRDRIADAIEQYLGCTIDNFELDKILMTAEDRAAFEIATQVWFFYDDCVSHKHEGKHKITEAGVSMIRRWIRLLRSDRDWPIDEPDSRNQWYSPSRWKGIAAPIGCIIGLIMLPWFLFEIVVVRWPLPRFGHNEYWPFQTLGEWDSLSTSQDLPTGEDDELAFRTSNIKHREELHKQSHSEDAK